jgi:hypothetical protein
MKSSESLASKASRATGKHKQKATSSISITVPKKVRNAPNGDDTDNSAFNVSTTPEPDAARAIRNRKKAPSVVNIDADDDDDNSSAESDMPIKVESSDAELGECAIAQLIT